MKFIIYIYIIMTSIDEMQNVYEKLFTQDVTSTDGIYTSEQVENFINNITNVGEYVDTFNYSDAERNTLKNQLYILKDDSYAQALFYLVLLQKRVLNIKQLDLENLNIERTTTSIESVTGTISEDRKEITLHIVGKLAWNGYVLVEYQGTSTETNGLKEGSENEYEPVSLMLDNKMVNTLNVGIDGIYFEISFGSDPTNLNINRTSPTSSIKSVTGTISENLKEITLYIVGNRVSDGYVLVEYQGKITETNGLKEGSTNEYEPVSLMLDNKMVNTLNVSIDGIEFELSFGDDLQKFFTIINNLQTQEFLDFSTYLGYTTVDEYNNLFEISTHNLTFNDIDISWRIVDNSIVITQSDINYFTNLTIKSVITDGTTESEQVLDITLEQDGTNPGSFEGNLNCLLSETNIGVYIGDLPIITSIPVYNDEGNIINVRDTKTLTYTPAHIWSHSINYDNRLQEYILTINSNRSVCENENIKLTIFDQSISVNSTIANGYAFIIPEQFKTASGTVSFSLNEGDTEIYSSEISIQFPSINNISIDGNTMTVSGTNLFSGNVYSINNDIYLSVPNIVSYDLNNKPSIITFDIIGTLPSIFDFYANHISYKYIAINDLIDNMFADSNIPDVKEELKSILSVADDDELKIALIGLGTSVSNLKELGIDITADEEEAITIINGIANIKVSEDKIVQTIDTVGSLVLSDNLQVRGMALTAVANLIDELPDGVNKQVIPVGEVKLILARPTPEDNTINTPHDSEQNNAYAGTVDTTNVSTFYLNGIKCEPQESGTLKVTIPVGSNLVTSSELTNLQNLASTMEEYDPKYNFILEECQYTIGLADKARAEADAARAEANKARAEANASRSIVDATGSVELEAIADELEAIAEELEAKANTFYINKNDQLYMPLEDAEGNISVTLLHNGSLVFITVNFPAGLIKEEINKIITNATSVQIKLSFTK